MSNYQSDIICPKCKQGKLYAWDCSQKYGHMNPYVLGCDKCETDFRWNEQDELVELGEED